MAADPYGYPDAAPADPAGAASTSMWCGIGALMSGMLAPYCCYMGYFIALPLSIAALYYGTRGRNAASESERNSANAGLVSGTLALAVSLMWTVILVTLAVFYALIFVFAIFGAALEGM